MKCENGRMVSDVVTGFAGTVIGVVEYITGCSQALVQPRVNAAGEFQESRWIDVDRLAVDAADRKLALPLSSAGQDKEAPRR